MGVDLKADRLVGAYTTTAGRMFVATEASKRDDGTVLLDILGLTADGEWSE